MKIIETLTNTLFLLLAGIAISAVIATPFALIKVTTELHEIHRSIDNKACS